jgi:hypothetical protein
VKSQPKQTLFAAGGSNLRPNVQEGRGQQRSAGKDADPPGPLHDEDAPTAITSVCCEERLLQPCGNLMQGDIRGEGCHIG